MRAVDAGEFREQGRGVTGALLVLGVPAVFTMEAWWLAQRLPVTTLLLYAFVGLLVVFSVTHTVGFREEHEEHARPFGLSSLTDFAEIVLQSLVASYVVTFLFGILDVTEPTSIARMGLFFLVPFSFGAALANTVLSGEHEREERHGKITESLVVFAFGALFLAFPIAPTEEVPLLAARLGWGRLFGVGVVSLLLTFLVLYLLEFRGQTSRIQGRTLPSQLASTCVVYVIALAVSALLLAGFGVASEMPLSVWVRETVVLGFAASIGAAGAQVVVA